jgi:hypothetical protein
LFSVLDIIGVPERTTYILGRRELFRSLSDPRFDAAIEDNRHAEIMLQEAVAGCLKQVVRNQLVSCLESPFYTTIAAPFMGLFLRAALLMVLLDRRDKIGDILSALMIKDGRIDILVHPFTAALATAADIEFKEYIKPESDLSSGFPRIKTEDLDKLPFLFGLNGLYADTKLTKIAGRTVRFISAGREYALKLMRGDEEPSGFNFEAWVYAELAKIKMHYTGILPEPQLADKNAEGVFLGRVPAASLPLAVRRIKNSLYHTEDGYFIGFVYKAEPGYFDYCQHIFGPQKQSSGLMACAAGS